jgi:hypothetical protein
MAGVPIPAYKQFCTDKRCVAKQAFEFCNTRNGTRVITKDMVNFQVIKLHFKSNNLSFYSFPKSENPIKAVILHLPGDLGDLGFEAVRVRQLSTTHRSLEGTPIPFVPCNSTQYNQIPRAIQTVQPLPQRHQCRGIQISKSPYAMLQLRGVWTCLGKLQATIPWQPPT